jgi:hypothetical protein
LLRNSENSKPEALVPWMSHPAVGTHVPIVQLINITELEGNRSASILASQQRVTSADALSLQFRNTYPGVPAGLRDWR